MVMLHCIFLGMYLTVIHIELLFLHALAVFGVQSPQNV